MATTIALEGYRQNVMLFERLSSLVTAIGPFGQPSLIVAAAGNESGRDATPPFEIACAPPAVSEGIVSVAALGQVGSTLDVASFSNTNAIVAAPGVGMTSAKAGGGLVVDERHQHGDAARRRRGGAVGAEDPVAGSAARDRVDGAAHRVRHARRPQGRHRPERHRSGLVQAPQ